MVVQRTGDDKGCRVSHDSRDRVQWDTQWRNLDAVRDRAGLLKQSLVVGRDDKRHRELAGQVRLKMLQSGRFQGRRDTPERAGAGSSSLPIQRPQMIDRIPNYRPVSPQT